MHMREKTVLITGASRGIGQYLSVYFAQRCRKVIGVARSADGLERTAAKAAGGMACFEAHIGDLNDTFSLEGLAQELQAKDCTIDILIHNAADVTSKPFEDTTLDEMERQVRTNVTGPLQLTKLLLPMMLDREDPAIVTVSSLVGYKPNPAQTVYSITKWALNGLAHALRAELGPKGFHVLNVALSSVDIEGDGRRGAVPVADFAAALERALENKEDELFLSGASKWLMRLYQFYPPLARMK